jgi:hypothetical protein
VDLVKKDFFIRGFIYRDGIDHSVSAGIANARSSTLPWILWRSKAKQK